MENYHFYSKYSTIEDLKSTDPKSSQSLVKILKFITDRFAKLLFINMLFHKKLKKKIFQIQEQKSLLSNIALI